MSRWSAVRVLELTVYALVILVSFWHIPDVCVSIWKQECNSNRQCRRYLRKAWPGGTVDLADDQWRELRDNLPLLVMAIVAHSLLSLLVRRSTNEGELQMPSQQQTQQLITEGTGGKRAHRTVVDPSERHRATTAQKRSNSTSPTTSSTSPSPSASPFPPSANCLPMGTLGRRRTAFNGAASIVFLLVMHGAHAFFPAALVTGAFVLGHATKGTRLASPIAWVAAVGMIWLKERFYAAPFFTFVGLVGRELGAGLDSSRGLHGWRLSFNLAILRIVSFNLDLHWAELAKRKKQIALCAAPAEPQKSSDASSVSGGTHEQAERDTKVVGPYDYSARVVAHRPLEEYSLWHCLGYVFYAPLYLAGPTLTFNAYMSQMACPQKSYGKLQLLVYLLRLLLALSLLEFGLRTMPVFALARAGLLNFSPGQLACLVYVILKLMWLKFLVIWRLFRLWALCDGVEPPENMQRCMSNNYSVANFWKGWHCSFNRWLVRYIYVPLGGAKAGRRWNVFVVFIFVALWHDVEAKLFLWGLLNGVFLVLEGVVRGVYSKAGAFERCRASSLVNRLIQGLGSTSSIMVLFLVNLIGYTVGISGTRDLIDNILLARDGQISIAVSFVFLFSGVQIMFAIDDARKGSTQSSGGNRKVAQS